jgi:hypothetical protein
MSKTVGIALAIAILALAAAVALPELSGGETVGTYQMVAAGGGSMYRMDTTTGDAWISVDGGDWELIGEADDQSAPGATARPAHAIRGTHGVRAVGAHRLRRAAATRSGVG